eukprot:gene14319-4201_t
MCTPAADPAAVMSWTRLRGAARCDAILHEDAVPVRDAFECFGACERHRECAAVELAPPPPRPARNATADGRWCADAACARPCATHADCEAGCVNGCYPPRADRDGGTCYTTDGPDARCAGKPNGHGYPNGLDGDGWCWDGRKDRHCARRAPRYACVLHRSCAAFPPRAEPPVAAEYYTLRRGSGAGGGVMLYGGTPATRARVSSPDPRRPPGPHPPPRQPQEGYHPIAPLQRSRRPHASSAAALPPRRGEGGTAPTPP